MSDRLTGCLISRLARASARYARTQRMRRDVRQAQNVTEGR